ncbi:hypothetical protein CANCADRAFT_1981 [Tortispora caseinolytica NRRL Y-17796]|uniref:Uncharacterized protein n=1 Tax=Tortispora caseinolytica NRRL Y-17796 TaxID=767744 RepID=A0A1E4TER1_9ASCO|nr:hypothetical protein CANCADRAFT_1981 [Tortispora caseinolytica NRRL Y-17796]
MASKRHSPVLVIQIASNGVSAGVSGSCETLFFPAQAPLFTYTQLYDTPFAFDRTDTLNAIDQLIRSILHKLNLSSDKIKVLVCESAELTDPLKKALLHVLKSRLYVPTVSLYPLPCLAAISAGSRNALVVHVDWSISTVTPVYDLRLLQSNQVLVHRGLSLLHKTPAYTYDHVQSVFVSDSPSDEPGDSSLAPYSMNSLKHHITSLPYCSLHQRLQSPAKQQRLYAMKAQYSAAYFSSKA